MIHINHALLGARCDKGMRQYKDDLATAPVRRSQIPSFPDVEERELEARGNHFTDLRKALPAQMLSTMSAGTACASAFDVGGLESGPSYPLPHSTVTHLLRSDLGRLTTMKPLGTAVSPCEAIDTVTRTHPLLAKVLISLSN
jgi:hypothetical protein